MTLEHDPGATSSPPPPSGLDRRQEATRITTSHGPFPDPAQVQAYEDAAPGTGAFILEEAAKAEAARQIQAREAQRIRGRTQSLAILSALGVCGLAFATGSVSLLEGISYEGLAVSGTGLIGLVLALIRAGQSQE